MIKLNVLKILKQKHKTKYWLYNQMNMSYQNFNNMITNKTQSIKYSNLALLCEILECSPDDLFVFVPDKK